MQRLQSISLKNFQVHQDLQVEFSPTVTTIRGATDAGKSSILRALRWVCQNHLGGEEFITEGEKVVNVTLEVDNHTITRSKSRSGMGNAYELDGKEFRAFGTGVPSDITNLLSISDINFQDQMDSPFWLSETAGEVSRRLNSVVDLSLIDSSLSKIGAELHRSQERVFFSEERLKEVQSEYFTVESQQQRIEDFQTLSSLFSARQTADGNYSQLNELISTIKDCREQVHLWSEQTDEKKVLLVTAREVLQFTDGEKELSSLIHSIERFQAVQCPPPFDPIVTAHEEAVTTEQIAGRLGRLVDSVAETQNLAILRNKQAKEVEYRFHLRVQGKRCPLCGKMIE